ncbi:MAG: VanZ family protein [Myxococcales bacterium]|nr:VanZ family protein [Myxococcales bacterium]MCB9643640.1 VanZ family protein [Myxococcales bacterium]
MTQKPLRGWNWEAGAALLFMGVIFFASSRSQLPSALFPIGNMDKLYHGLAFALLGWLLAGAFSHWLTSAYWIVWSATCSATLYGFLDEFHQSFVPGRDSSGGDLIADAIGALIGSLIWWLTMRSRFQSSKE